MQKGSGRIPIQWRCVPRQSCPFICKSMKLQFLCSLFRFISALIVVCISYTYIPVRGDRGSTVVKVCAINRKVAGSIPDGVIGFFR
jgi:hypothetical protein